MLYLHISKNIRLLNYYLIMDDTKNRKSQQCAHTAFLCSVSQLLAENLFSSNKRDIASDTSAGIISVSADDSSADNVSKSFGSCRICGKSSFADRAEQSQHYKSQLHIVNLKRSLMGLPAVSDIIDNDDNDVSDMELKESSDSEESEEETDLFVDADEVGSHALNRDLSGTVETSEQTCTSFPEGTVVKTYNNVTGAMYRFIPTSFPTSNIVVPAALLSAVERTSAMSPSGDNGEGTNAPQSRSPWTLLSAACTWNPRKPYVAVLLLQSGRFAGAIFDTRTCLSSAGKQTKMLDTVTQTYFRENHQSSTIPYQQLSTNFYNGASLTCIKHKAIRRYTVRAKAGGSQSSHDGQGKKAKSMGAQLRRYGEQKLKDDVYDVLREWGSDGLLDQCAYILVSVGRTLQHVLFRDSNSSSSASTSQEEYPYKLAKSDPRVVRGLGMMVDKPTLEECCRVFRLCTAVTFEKSSEVVSTTEGSHVHVAPAEVVVENAMPVPYGVSVAVPCGASVDAFALSNGDGGNPDEMPIATCVSTEELREDTPLLARLLLNACQCDDVETVRMVVNGLKLAHSRRHDNNSLTPASPSGAGREEQPEDDTTVDETVIELDDEDDDDAEEAPRAQPSILEDDTTLQAMSDGGMGADGSQSEIAALLVELSRCLSAEAQVQVQGGDDGHTELQFTTQELLNLYISQLSLLEATGDGDMRSSLYYSIVNTPENFVDFRTPLHIACQRGCAKTVKLLLLSGMADPTKLDASGQTPYQLCQRKDCKIMFRRVRALYESETAEIARQHGRCAWNWDNCGGVPPGLSAEAERAQKQKQKDKKKRAKASKKGRVQQQREELEAAAAQQQEQAKLQEEQQRLAAHRAGHCCVCDVSLLNNKLVVNVFDQKCCTAKCVMALRRRLAADAAEKRLAKS